ncbi:hypothetical protein DRN58_01460 [Thermococci archaeon]|nr:MAG: hypothetical protein DRN58_01460 [Thermococci archaeon]HHF09612.1 hypothetical protein [Methanomicrobia archaeon]
MELKFIAIALAILNILIYLSLIMRIKKRGGKGIPKTKKLKLKKLEPVIAPPKSKVTWDESITDDIDLYWEEAEKEEKEIEEKEEKEIEETIENDEERRVKLLWEGYMKKLDKFIEKLEKGSPGKYFEYYKEYENLDKFYSRFVFNFGLYLDEMEKNRASGRLGYCSTLLKEMLGEV